MKHSKYILLAMVLLSVFLWTLGCQKDTRNKKVDYTNYPFADFSWTREAENDTETIRFYSDGRYSYYCACGNPVNDSDLNRGYTYDDETKTITISYFETTEETIPEIKLEKCTDDILKLNFNGEIREFTKSKK